MKYSIQLYSCRDSIREDMDGTLKRLSEIGYSYVETAGFAGHTAKEVRDMLDKYGLKALGTHTGVGELADEKIEETIRNHKIIGADTIIIPSCNFSTKEDIDAVIDLINKVQPKLEAEGLKLAYHNHSFEFFPNQDGLYMHKELETKTNIDFEIDTFWAYNAGVDPIEIITRLKDRIHFVHIKDGFAAKDPINQHADGMPLGMGNAPCEAVYNIAKELSIQLVVESETQNPDGITEADICFKFLKSCEK